MSKYLREKVLITQGILDLSVPKLVAVLWPEASAEDVEHWRERIYSWRKSTPVSNSKYISAFFVELHRVLRCNISTRQLSESTMIEFFNAIDKQLRGDMSFDALAQNLKLNDALKTNFPTVHIDWQAIHERLHTDLSRSFSSGKIDQKFLYMSYDSVRIWKDLIARDYKTYRHCTEALEAFLQSDFWLNHSARGTFDCIVDLGVGAGDKDISIIDGLLAGRGNNQLRLVLVDTSSYMIDASLQHLEKRVHSFGHRLVITPLRKDFLDLPTARPLLHNHRRTGFFILGNTFANISEVRFMRSLQQVARKGDLLVIGAEFLDPVDPDKVLDETKKEFENSVALKELAITPISFVRANEDNKKLLASVRAATSEAGAHSDLHRPRAIVIFCNVDGRKIDIAYSNRYERSEFVEFVSKYNFDLKGEFPSRNNPNYRQMIFEKMKSQDQSI